MSNYLYAFFLVCMSALLVACAPPSRVVVEERKTIDPRVEAERIGGSRIRIVQPGDTLHAIAFANALNVNKLAAWNRLADTSQLRIGQRIRLTRPLNFKEPSVKVVSSEAGPEINKVPRDGASSVLNTKSIETQPLDSENNTGRSTLSTPQVVSTRSENTKEIKDKTAALNQRPTLANLPVRWKWPVEGKLIGGFSNSAGRQGIDIQGQAGQAVLAAGGGQVVYVGNGLKGYGNLIIIKHNDQFLSAYAHNQSLFVEEGQFVEVSQRIASVGKDNKQRNALHFQIRQEGKPMNPLAYLPER